MKRIAFSLLLLISALLVVTSGCDKVKDLASFDVRANLPDYKFTLDSASISPALKMGGTEVLLGYFPAAINIDSVFSHYGVDEADIENSSFTMVQLTIQSPEGVTFDWLSSARIVVSSSPTLAGGVQVAHTATFSSGSSTITFIVDETGINNMITNGVFYVGIYGILSGPIPVQTVGLALKSQIVYTVNPL